MNRSALIGLISLAALGALLLQAHSAVRAPALRSLSAEEERWAARIREVGGKEAYGEFGESVASASPELQHAGAHVFGAALYEAVGTAGLSVCDANFNFGCFHEFLGRAIATQGLSAVPSLNEGCFDSLTESPLSCQHGIGHGVIAYFGYDERALDESLLECRDLPHSDPIGGCYGGVFMEYNLQTMLATQARLRPLGENPLDPCDRLDKEYRPACYYWQPQLWAQSLRPDLVGGPAFARMGQWCTSARGNEKDCFEGMGNIASPESNFSPEEAKTLCEQVSRDWRYQLYCKSVAANSLALGGGGKKADGMAVCAGLEGEAMEYCAAYARNESNVLNRGALQGE